MTEESFSAPIPEPGQSAEPEQPTAEEPQPTTEEPNGSIEIPEAPERPEWLDEKFQSPEDLAKAYRELEKRAGAAAGESPSGSENELGIFARIRQELEESGELTDETFAVAEKLGMSREDLAAQIDALRFTRTHRESEFVEQFGGQEKVAEIIDWASRNAPRHMAQEFNRLSKAGRYEEAGVIFGGFAHAMGSAPAQGEFVKGTKPMTSPAGAATPIQNRKELIELMSDPRYKRGDKDFHAEFDRRLAISKDLPI